MKHGLGCYLDKFQSEYIFFYKATVLNDRMLLKHLGGIGCMHYFSDTPRLQREVHPYSSLNFCLTKGHRGPSVHRSETLLAIRFSLNLLNCRQFLCPSFTQTNKQTEQNLTFYATQAGEKFFFFNFLFFSRAFRGDPNHF